MSTIWDILRWVLLSPFPPYAWNEKLSEGEQDGTLNGCPPKNMADMWAGHNLKSSPTHPGFEAEFQVLSAPDVKSRVVSAKLLKKGPVDGKKTTWEKNWE